MFNRLSIRLKLIALILVATLITAMVVGLSFRMLLNDVFLKDAKTEIENGIINLAHDIRGVKQNLIDSTSLISHNLNISSDLKKINDNPSVELRSIKEKIALKLLDQIEYAFMNEIYVYNAAHEMIAFAQVTDNGYICGYQHNGNKKIIFTKTDQEREFSVADKSLSLPIYEYRYTDPFSKYATTAHYRVFNDNFNILAHKDYIENNEVLGAITMSKVLTREHVNFISKKLNIDMRYIISDEDIEKFKKEYQIDLNDDKMFIPPLFSNIRETVNLIDRKDEFLSVSAVQTNDKTIYVISNIKKDLLDEAVLKSEKDFFIIITVFSLLLIVISIYVINNILGKPLGNILRNVKLIEQGDYNINKYIANDDEIGKISNTISNMAETIQTREKDLDERVRKEVEKNRKKDEQMLHQSRLAQMGEMISMIAHQWRQPLSAISATSIDLQMKMFLKNYKDEAELIDYSNESLQQIDEFVKNLTTTIDDFRNFYKPNKDTELTTLEEVVSKSLHIIKSSLDNQGVEVILDIKSNDELKLYKNEIMQVLLNILKNSQDCFKERKTQNPFIKITIDEKSVSICDNAGGISEDITDKIFDPYFSTKSEKQGTGLGLYMSKTIVEEHHKGDLSVENTDKGVCFRIKIGTID